jgi:hypothetical protein
VCGDRLLALCSKLRVPVGAARLACLNCVVPTRQRWPLGLLVLVCGLPGVMAAAAGIREQSLWAVGVPGPDFPYWPQGVQFYGAATHSGEPSQQVVGILWPNLPHRLLEVHSCGTAISLGEQSLCVAGVPGPELSFVVLLPGKPSLLDCTLCYL